LSDGERAGGPDLPPDDATGHPGDPEWELADYLAGELSGPALERFQHRLQVDPQLAEEARILGELAGELQRLPSAAWDVLGAIDSPAQRTQLARPQQPDGRRPRRSWRGAGRPAAGLAALVAALGIGFGVGVLAEQPAGVSRRAVESSGPAVVLRALVPGVSGARALVRLEPRGRIAIYYRRMPRPPAGHYYEAWLMSSQTSLVALGSFTPPAGGSGELQTELPAPVSDYRYIDISVQTVSAGPAISRESVMRAATAALLR
jgi:hypothetical protein